MSRIRKLSIKGIRNFDDDGESNSIRFSGPLTLILGPNGTGKTTIIECLKYGLSGEFPPDSDRGKAFIHDPTLKKLKVVQVRGNVKVEVADCKGEVKVISRSVEAVCVEKGVRFKTLDSTLSRVDRNTGQTFSLTSRCADINEEVMMSMGVSKAILNYVLFCHQDDANWPFESGKKLKERFDEIFDTTSYNKAQDIIRKEIKERQSQLKGLETERRALNIIVEEVESKEKKLVDFQERRDEMQKKIRDLSQALKPINDRLAEIQEIETEYCKWQIENEKKKLEYKLAKEQILSLKENIKEPYEGSTASLNNEIESYEEILCEKNNEIAELERELRDGTEKETKISSLIAERRVTVGTLRQQIHDQTQKIAKRNENLRDMLSAWKMPERVESNASEEDAAKLIKKLEEKLRQKEQQMEAERIEQEHEQEQLERKVNVLRAERSTIESQLAHNESELIKIKGEIRTNRALLRQSGAMEQKLNEVDANLDEANKKVKELTETFEIDSLKSQIQEAASREEEYERKFVDADKEVTLLREQSTLQMKLESSQAELMDKEKEVQVLREKHEDTLKMLLGKTEFPEGNMMETVNGVQAILNKRVQNLRNEIEKVQYEAMKLKTSVEHKKQELHNKEKEVEKDKERISLHCKDYTNYREVLLVHSKKVKDLEDKRGMYAYQGVAYKGYIKQLTEPESCCPLCHREFENSRDATLLATELRNDMSGHPSRLQNCEKELASQRNKYDSLLQLQPVVEKIENFERVEITKMRQEVENESKKLSALTEKVKRLQESMAEPERKLSNCKNMIGDMALWDRYSNEIEIINASVVEFQETLRNAGLKSDKTIQEAQAEHTNLQEILKDTRREMKTLQATLDSRNEALRRATESRTKLLEQQLRIHQDMQDIKQAKETLDSLLTKETTAANNIRGFEERMAEIDDKLESAINNLESVKQDFRTKQESSRKTLREYSKDLDQLNSIHTEVVRMIAQKIDNRLKSTEEQLQTVEKKAVQLKAERANRESRISKMKQDLVFHDTRKRDLVDNLTLRRKEAEAESLKTARQKILDKLAGANLDTVSREREKLCESRDSTERERNKALGNEEELGRNVEQLSLEMKKREYRNARDNYKDKSVELTVAQLTIEDLHSYSKAMDVAMIQFHEERMNTVNQFMKKLWNLIYTGTDTTSIQIRTEATTSTVDKKRQFNYKLVQMKHGVEMDMRGRCSAGQKVLATIILRLALAETFCERCGVLALDEPTTNLDDENAKSLADALHKYVNLRKSQKNFQLIIITHDGNFISKLGQLSINNSYYELYRNDDGLSGIRRVSLDGPPLKSRDIETISSGDEAEDVRRAPPKRVKAPPADAPDGRKRKRHVFE